MDYYFQPGDGTELAWSDERYRFTCHSQYPCSLAMPYHIINLSNHSSIRSEQSPVLSILGEPPLYFRGPVNPAKSTICRSVNISQGSVRDQYSSMVCCDASRSWARLSWRSTLPRKCRCPGLIHIFGLFHSHSLHAVIRLCRGCSDTEWKVGVWLTRLCLSMGFRSVNLHRLVRLLITRLLSASQPCSATRLRSYAI